VGIARDPGRRAAQTGGHVRKRSTDSNYGTIDTHTDKAGRKWRPNDFILSALVETHDWKNEPMVLISSGQLIEQLGLDKTQRRFSFAELTASAELQRLVTEAQARTRVAKHRRRGGGTRPRISSGWDRNALYDRRAAAGDEHV
jgi:hypothetical protein